MLKLPETRREALAMAFAAHRKSMGITQVEAAIRAGVSQPTLSRWERGVIDIALDGVLRLCGPVGTHEIVFEADRLLAMYQRATRDTADEP